MTCISIMTSSAPGKQMPTWIAAARQTYQHSHLAWLGLSRTCVLFDWRQRSTSVWTCRWLCLWSTL